MPDIDPSPLDPSLDASVIHCLLELKQYSEAQCLQWESESFWFAPVQPPLDDNYKFSLMVLSRSLDDDDLEFLQRQFAFASGFHRYRSRDALARKYELLAAAVGELLEDRR